MKYTNTKKVINTKEDSRIRSKEQQSYKTVSKTSKKMAIVNPYPSIITLSIMDKILQSKTQNWMNNLKTISNNILPTGDSL